jgi:NAD(P)-dependent dehydrogenase (short-subunit alcohol dehydrogenase family)
MMFGRHRPHGSGKASWPPKVESSSLLIFEHAATNHIGHFLFSNLIMPKIIKASEGNPNGTTRVINVSSGAAEQNGIRWSDVNFDKLNKDLPAEEQPNYRGQQAWGIQDGENKSYVQLEAYIQSKAANVLYSIGLTQRLYEKFGILSVALHPGVIKTELGRNNTKERREAIENMAKKGVFQYKTLGAGSSTTLVAATDPKLGPMETKNGKEGYGSYLADCQISAAHPRASSSSEADKLWALSEKLVDQKFQW